MRGDLGRHMYGAAALLFGLIGLSWHDFDAWQQLHSLWSVATFGPALVYLVGISQVAGGLAIQWRKTMQIGAAILGVVYLFFALRWVPKIAAAPQIYDSWGNLFEQSSLVSAAVIVFASAGREARWTDRARPIGRYCFGVCVISFTLEQLFYLSDTASFVPKWVPPGQMFWAITTTVALALAAVAILSGVWALLASRLLTLMFLIFELLIWMPRLVFAPHLHMNWGGNAQNLAITGAAWVVADYLTRAR
jgi:hypothetical protein